MIRQEKILLLPKFETGRVHWISSVF